MRAAVYFFDRCLVLANEMKFIWRRRGMSVATISYILMHASTSLYMVLLVTGALIDIGCEVSSECFVYFSLTHRTLYRGTFFPIS